MIVNNMKVERLIREASRWATARMFVFITVMISIPSINDHWIPLAMVIFGAAFLGATTGKTKQAIRLVQNELRKAH